MRKRSNPLGMADPSLLEIKERNRLERLLENYVMQWGFERIETPLLEFNEVFTQKGEVIPPHQMMKMIDRDGSVVVIRPDLTVPAARVVSTRMDHDPLPIKLYYCGKVYQHNKLGDTEGREFTQFGIEHYGDNSIYADLDCIRLTIESLKLTGLKNFQLDLGHVKFITGAMKALALSKEMEEQVIKYIEEKNLVELERLVEDGAWAKASRELLMKIPSLFGDPEKVLTAAKAMPLHPEMVEALEYLERLYGLLKGAGLETYVSLDLGMAGNRGYYTGLIMKAYTFGLGKLIANGGRYDGLLEEFGPPCSAVGFALYLDRISHVTCQQQEHAPGRIKELVIFDEASYQQAYDYARNIIETGGVVSLQYGGTIEGIDAYQRQYGFTRIVDFTTGESGTPKGGVTC